MDPAEYCREIESYLCRKNEGHLIRIVGPQFEQVCGWAQQGVPLKIAFRGIDQYCERYYAKGPRRRPVRIEYCEADILELFDGWRRAIGVSAGTGEGTTIEAPAARKPALAGHVERAIARLTASRAGARRSGGFDTVVDGVVRELDRLAPDAKQARGDARARVIERLAALDVDLLAAASGEIDPQQAAALKREAEAELAPFKSRMPPEVRDRAIAAAYRRLVREALGLPVLEYE
jgi:hypothetical protein